MAKPAIKVEGLWKEYVIGAQQKAHGTFYDMLSSSLSAPFRALRKRTAEEQEAESFWALRDVNFEVQPGEVVGIIGRNGAGKSTLLKILSRITAPTRGHVEVRGRLASLLEVGTGFHPELSGRENIFLNGAILGMTRAEVARKFHEIVAFAEIEKFVDTPVKRYSSGMYVRLAFAVAAHLEPDVLVIDEVLAVGDADFQQRCLGKMHEVAGAGRTVVFVSHNLAALKNLCSSGLLLSSGQSTYYPDTTHALRAYADVRGQVSSGSVVMKDVHDGIAAVRRVDVNSAARGSHEITVTSGLNIGVEIEVMRAESDVSVFLHCHDESQTRMFSTGSFFAPELNGMTLCVGMHRFVCNVPGSLLNVGTYTIDVMLMQDKSQTIVSEPSVISFRIHDDLVPIQGWNWAALGAVSPPLAWLHQYPREKQSASKILLDSSCSTRDD